MADLSQLIPNLATISDAELDRMTMDGRAAREEEAEGRSAKKAAKVKESKSTAAVLVSDEDLEDFV